MRTTAADSSPYGWKEVRVFLSSTFRDFHAERDYLVKYVFPELRQWGEAYRLHLVDIDLRWGVTPAEAESGKVIDLCLEQVDGCRPFFLCMLGNRYGWVPRPEEIPGPTLDRFNRLREPDLAGYSITHMEIHHAVLQPLAGGEERPEAPQAFFYFRSERVAPQPDEISFWTPAERNEFARAFHEPDPSLSARLAALKDEIRRRFPPSEREDRIFDYSPVFDPALPNPEDDALRGRFMASSLKEFGARVLQDLKRAIGLRFAERIARLGEGHLSGGEESEPDLQERFVEIRTRGFVGRTGLLEKIRAYAEGDADQVLAVRGEAGSGKSSLLAQFCRSYGLERAAGGRSGESLFLFHFVGASPESSSLPHLLHRVCSEVKKAFALDPAIPAESDKLPEAFREFLELAPGRVLLLVDGLDQLVDGGPARGLDWLPSRLPPRVKMVVSTLPGTTEAALKQRTGLFLAVSPLDDDERREIIRRIPSLFAKTLSEEAVTALLSREETRNPLYLKVALEELRLFGGFGRSGEKLVEYLRGFPAEVVDLFAFVLRRLEREHNRPAGLVRKLFSLIEASRFGLTLGELQELLPEDREMTHRFILRQIRDYLFNRGETVDFFHQTFSRAVRRTFELEEPAAARPWHRTLAGYFMAQPIFHDPEGRRRPRLRKLAEEPFQQAAGRMWPEAAATLGDLWFVEAKIRAGMILDLQADYETLRQGLPEAGAEREREERDGQRSGRWAREIMAYAIRGAEESDAGLRFPEPPPASIPDWELKAGVSPAAEGDRLAAVADFRRFLRVKLNLLARYGRLPGLVVQEAFNFAADGPVGRAASAAAAGLGGLVCWLNRSGLRPAFNPRPALKRDFDDPTPYPARAMAVTPDGRMVVSGGYPVRAWDTGTGAVTLSLKSHELITGELALTPDGRLLLLPKDGQCLKLWDLERGILQATVGDDSDPGWSNAPLGMTPDGRFGYLVDRAEKTVRFFDLPSAASRGSVKLMPGAGREFAISVDGKRLYYASVAPDRPESRLYAVDTRSKKTTVLLGDIPVRIEKIALTPDGARVAVSGRPFRGREDRKGTLILVYDLGRQVRPAEFSDPAALTRGLKISADGRLLFFIGDGHALKVWDVGRRIPVRNFTGYAEMDSLDITPDGRLAVTGDADGHQRLWDVAGGRQLEGEFRFKGRVNDIAVSPDRQRLALAGEDGALTILEETNGGTLRRIEAHRKGIIQCLFVPGSRRLLSGGRDRAVQLRDADTGELLHAYRFEDRRVRISQRHPDGSRSTAGPLSIGAANLFATPDARRAVFNECGLNRVVRIIDLESGERIGTLRNLEEGAAGLALSAEGRLFYSTDAGRVQVTDLERLTVLKRLIGHREEINGLALTPDGRLAVTGSGAGDGADQTVRVWDAVRGEALAELGAFSNPISQVAVSPDGRFIAAAGGGHLAYFAGDNAIRVWETRSFRLLATLEGHEHAVHSLRFTADAGHLVSSSFDDTIRLWELSGNRCLAICCGGKGWNCDYAMSGLFGRGEFAYWNAAGRFLLLRPVNLAWTLPWVTAVRLWRYRESGRPGEWDDRFTAACPGCGRRFPVAGEVLEAIARIAAGSVGPVEAPPLRRLEADAWTDPDLVSACFHCREPLRFNPFLYDPAGLPEMFEPRPSGGFRKEKRARVGLADGLSGPPLNGLKEI